MSLIAAVAIVAVIAGCSSTSGISPAQVQAVATLGTQGALLAYPEYRPAMEAAEGVLSVECASTNGIQAATIEQLLQQNGVTNSAVLLGISGAVTLVDLFAASDVTNGVPAEQTIQEYSCPIAAGMNAALNPAAKAPVKAKHWWQFWKK